MNAAAAGVSIPPDEVLSSMRLLLDSTRYACQGTGIDDLSVSFKMFPKKVVDLVARYKDWAIEEVPVRMIRKIRMFSGDNDDDLGETDSSGFCLDYERRTVMKYVFGPFPSVCVCCGKTEQDVEKLKICSGCMVVRYCSPACQLRDWQQAHKKVCSALKEEHERGIVALPAGVFTQMWEW